MKRFTFAALLATISTLYASESLPNVEALLTSHGHELHNSKFPDGLPKVTVEDIREFTATLKVLEIPAQLQWFFLNFSHKVYPARTLVMPQAQFQEIAVGIIQDAWAMGVPKTHLPFCQDNGDYYCINLMDGSVRLWDHETKTFFDHYWMSFVEWIEKDWTPLFNII